MIVVGFICLCAVRSSAPIALTKNNEAADFDVVAAELANDDIDATIAEEVSGIKITEDTHILCIGDSYLQGWAPEGVRDSWGTIIGKVTGAKVTNYAQGGAGFSAYGQSGTNYSYFIDRINAWYSEDPDIVIIAGGINDSMTNRPTQSMVAGAKVAAEKILRFWPNAKVYFFINLWTNGTRPYGAGFYRWDNVEDAKAMQEAIESADVDGRITVEIDCWTWLYENTAEDICSYDAAHPLEGGQAIIADAMLKTIFVHDATNYDLSDPYAEMISGEKLVAQEHFYQEVISTKDHSSDANPFERFRAYDPKMKF